MVFLLWWGSSTTCGVVSRALDSPCSRVNDIIHRLAEKIPTNNNILTVCNTFLVWEPLTWTVQTRLLGFPPAEDLTTTGTDFECLVGSTAFFRVVGSIDGRHVRIKPPTADAQRYFNRKLFSSIQMQTVCDCHDESLETGLCMCRKWTQLKVSALSEMVDNPVCHNPSHS